MNKQVFIAKLPAVDLDQKVANFSFHPPIPRSANPVYINN